MVVLLAWQVWLQCNIILVRQAHVPSLQYLAMHCFAIKVLCSLKGVGKSVPVEWQPTYSSDQRTVLFILL